MKKKKKHKLATPYHSILYAKTKLIFRVWPLNLDFHNGSAGNNCQLNYGLIFCVLKSKG